MKTKLVLALLLCSTMLLNAQRNTGAPGAYEGPRFVIKTNPFPMLAGQIPFTNEYRLAFEFKIAPKSSIQITGAYVGRSPFLSLIENLSKSDIDSNVRIGVTGGRVQLTYKYYLLNSQQAPKGFYVGSNLSFATARFWNKNYTPDKVNVYYTSLTGLLGYQVIAGGHFAFDAFAGIGVKYNKYVLNIQSNNSGFDFNRLDWVGPKFMLGFNLGLRLVNPYPKSFPLKGEGL